MKKTLRKWVFQCHLYLGLSLGLLFSLIGITGSLLVFYLDIEAVLEPPTSSAMTTPSAIDLDAVLARLRSQFPQREGAWRIEMPLHSDDSLRVRYQKPIERSHAFFAPFLLTLHPHTLEITQQQYWGDSGMTWIYDLHYSLLLGQNGQHIVGFAGMFLLISLLTGLYLWWPQARHALKALKPVIRSPSVKRVYDLHVLSGIYGWIVLFAVSLTGVVLVWPQETRAILSQVTPVQAPPSVPSNANAAPLLSLQEAVRLAHSRFPAAEVRWVQSSGAKGEPISLRLYQSGEPSRRFPKTQIWLHPQTGAILATRNAFDLPWSESVLNWAHPLHNGEALGLTGRWIVLTSGLLLPLIGGTGLIRWRQKSIAYGKIKATHR
jgi:uncharacterized iron-regulated membrane protein